MSATGYVVIPGGGEGGLTQWGDVQNKPSTFPPDAHAHTYASITGKPTTFPPDAHAHDYAATGHTHPEPDISWTEVSGKPSTFPPSAHDHTYASITEKPTTFPPSAHNHAQSEVTGLETALAEPARVYVHNGSAYVLSTTTDIFIGPADPGSGLWIDTNA